MNITFLLGNGFDIGLGLKSGYKSFYPYFVDKANDDNLIRQAIEKEKKIIILLAQIWKRH